MSYTSSAVSCKGLLPRAPSGPASSSSSSSSSSLKGGSSMAAQTPTASGAAFSESANVQLPPAQKTFRSLGRGPCRARGRGKVAQKRPISAAEGWAREVGASVEATQGGSQARAPVHRPPRSPYRSAGSRIRFWARKDKRKGRQGRRGTERLKGDCGRSQPESGCRPGEGQRPPAPPLGNGDRGSRVSTETGAGFPPQPGKEAKKAHSFSLAALGPSSHRICMVCGGRSGLWEYFLRQSGKTAEGGSSRKSGDLDCVELSGPLSPGPAASDPQ